MVIIMKNHQKFLKKTNLISILILLFFLLLCLLIPSNGQTYFGGYPYLGLNYGLGSFFLGGRPNAIYGSTGIPGLPLGSIWNSLNTGLYGLGFSGGLLGGYSGLGGLGLYGMYGGFYGGLGLYGGLGSGLGTYGTSLLGLSGVYGGLLGSAGLGTTGLLGFGGLGGRLFRAEQVGTWTGSWTNFVVSGLMTLNLAEDILTGELYGYAQLLGNNYLDALIEVTGIVLNNQIFVSGSGVGLGNQNFTCEIIGILTSLSTMTGTYNMINNSSGGTITEQGSFSLALIAPVI